MAGLRSQLKVRGRGEGGDGVNDCLQIECTPRIWGPKVKAKFRNHLYVTAGGQARR